MSLTALGYLLLSVVFSLLIAHFLKIVEVKKANTLQVLTINYLTAGLLAVGVTTSGGHDLIPAFPLWMYGLAVIVGIFFIANFFVYSKSIHDNGVGVSITAMRVSLLIPVVISIAVYNEPLTLLRLAGILLVLMALILLVTDRRSKQMARLNRHWLLILLFLFTGIADASMKVFEQEGLAVATETHYLGIVFSTSFIIGLIAIIYKGMEKFTLRLVGLGVAIGVPNLLTSVFLIKALQHADGTVIYSAVNILTVIGGTLIGRFYWDDTITALQAFGMIMALVAIVILV